MAGFRDRSNAHFEGSEGMSDEKKYVVPEPMVKAAVDALAKKWGYTADVDLGQNHLDYCRSAVEAAVKWLAENPLVPDEEQTVAMAQAKARFPFDAWEWVRWGATEWQRRMFLAPSDPREKNIAAIFERLVGWKGPTPTREQILRAIEDAYDAGKEASPQPYPPFAAPHHPLPALDDDQSGELPGRGFRSK